MDGFKPYTEEKWLRENAGEPVIFEYGYFPRTLRVKLGLSIQLVLGTETESGPELWREVDRILKLQTGFRVPRSGNNWLYEDFVGYVEYDEDVEESDDEVILNIVGTVVAVAAHYSNRSSVGRIIPEAEITIEQAIAVMNQAFFRDSIGFQFINDRIVEVDSQFMHQEVTAPALSILVAEGFEGAADEFMRAYAHLKSGENADAVVDANKAFESTMKEFCQRLGIPLPAGEPSSKLVEKVYRKINATYMMDSLNNLGKVLSSVSNLRNSPAISHGQGAEVKEIGQYMAFYALHMMAANIIFIVEAYRDLKRR